MFQHDFLCALPAAACA